MSGTLESATSAATGLVSAAPLLLQGMAYHWKSHALLSGVTVQGATSNADAAGSDLLDLRGAQYNAADQSVSVQVWASPMAATQRVQFEVQASDAAASFTSALGAGWLLESQEQATGGVRVTAETSDAGNGGFTGATQIGTLMVSMPPGQTGTGVEIRNIRVGASLADAFRVDFVGQTTAGDGAFTFQRIPAGSYTIEASRSTGEAASAVTSADALAALRIAVGINPNADPDGTGPRSPLKLSPYQVIAADANSDGRVTSADALAILRMAVKSPGAPERQWLFVRETLDLWDEVQNASALSRGAAAWNALADYSLQQDTTLNLLGVLRGDVNGSWSPGVGAPLVDDAYFQALSTRMGAPMDAWGI